MLLGRGFVRSRAAPSLRSIESQPSTQGFVRSGPVRSCPVLSSSSVPPASRRPCRGGRRGPGGAGRGGAGQGGWGLAAAFPSHPIRVRRSILPLPGPLPGEAKGGGGCAHPAARRLARRGARHADPLLPRRGARPGLGRGRGGEPGGLGPTGAWTSPGAAARTPPPRGAREVGGRARALAPPSLLPSWWIRSTSCPRGPRGPAAAARPPGSTSTPAVPRSRVDQHPVGAASPRRLPGRRRPGLSPSRGATSRPGLPPRPARFRQPHGAPVSPPLRGSTSKPFPRARLHSPCGGLEWFVPPPPVFHTQRFPRSRP